MPISQDELRDLLTERSTPATARPAPIRELDTRIRRARRRRGIVTAAGTAGTAVVVAGIALAVAGPWSVDHGRDRVAAAPTTFPAVGDGKVLPADRLWPQAIHKVPVRLPGGRRFAPRAFLDDGSVLVTTESGFERVGELWRYDLTTKRATRLARVSIPEKVKRSQARRYPSEFTAGGGYIAWHMAYVQRGRYFVEVWAVPQTGGKPRPVTSMRVPDTRSGSIDRLAIAGGSAVWSFGDFGARDGRAEVFWAPLAGGPARPLPETGGYHIVSWPWIGSPGHTPEAVAGKVTYRELRNVQTGARKTANIRGGSWTCSLTWCTTSGSADPAGRIRAQRRDGTGARTLPYRPPVGDIGLPPALDRFLVLNPADGANRAVLYDLATGAAGDLGPPPAVEGGVAGAPIRNSADRLYATETGNSYLIIDLAAIR
jgi:hypothetical protein